MQKPVSNPIHNLRRHLLWGGALILIATGLRIWFRHNDDAPIHLVPQLPGLVIFRDFKEAERFSHRSLEGFAKLIDGAATTIAIYTEGAPGITTNTHVLVLTKDKKRIAEIAVKPKESPENEVAKWKSQGFLTDPQDSSRYLSLTKEQKDPVCRTTEEPNVMLCPFVHVIVKEKEGVVYTMALEEVAESTLVDRFITLVDAQKTDVLPSSPTE